MIEQNWTLELPCKRKWYSVNLRELWGYRDLIRLFVRRDFIASYKQTILGPLWFLLQPLVTTVIFTVVFGEIIGISTGQLPKALFFLSGVVVWNYFSSCLQKNSEFFVSNANIFKKVYFPRLVVPISTLIVTSITFLIHLGIFLSVYFYYVMKGAPVRLDVSVMLLPVVLLQVAVLGFSVGILISSLTIKYRDLAFLTTFALQLWMYATPIVYPASLIADGWQWLYSLNPMTSIVETFRYVFWDVGTISIFRFVVSNLETLALFLLAVKVFNRVESSFVDTV